jgi:hypothetical protein
LQRLESLSNQKIFQNLIRKFGKRFIKPMIWKWMLMDPKIQKIMRLKEKRPERRKIWKLQLLNNR